MSEPIPLPRCEECGRVREVAAVLALGGARVCLDCFTRLVPGEGVPQPVITGPLPPEPKPAPAGGGKPPGRSMKLAAATEFPARPLRWLWKPYVPLGKVAVLAGPPGQGKSQLSLWLAARITRGELIHDVREPADVVLISAEDDPNDTIVPRLTAVGADHTRVHLLHVTDVAADGAEIDGALALPTDAAKLEAAMGDRPVRLIVLDPVSSFLDAGVDSYKNTSVRRALNPLKALAEKRSAAVLTVTHLSKGASAGEPLEKVIDSIAFTAFARSVAIMAADPTDIEGTRGSSKVLLLAKSNNAPPGEHAQRFELVGKEVPTNLGPTGTSCVEQRGAADDVSAGDLMMPPEARSELGDAEEFLRAELRDGWRPMKDITKAAHAAGISERTLRRARERIGERKKEPKQFGGWWWGLKGVPLPPELGGPPPGTFEAHVVEEAERHLREAERNRELREQVRRQKEEGGHASRPPHLGRLGPLDEGGQDDQAKEGQGGQGAADEDVDPFEGWTPYRPAEADDDEDDDTDDRRFR